MQLTGSIGMTKTVALVLSSDSPLMVEALALCMPIWIADVPENMVFKRLFLRNSGDVSITWFPVRQGEEMKSAASRIIFSLDDHYNEDAQSIGYQGLLVVGAPYEVGMNDEYAILGFKRLEATGFGFVAMK
ncbi:hypothetical protein [Acidovorax anthurii]|uniref:hypothetical protein n=2 Tax=Paracidovorax anthurii TaxID=78229 RepID=UPI0014749B48